MKQWFFSRTYVISKKVQYLNKFEKIGLEWVWEIDYSDKNYMA